MPKDNTAFFETKDNHPWSRPPYVAKIIRKGQPLLFIDAFAGPGLTEDHEPGSPFLICQAAEKYAPNSYQAIFVNNDVKYHERLKELLTKANFRSAIPVLADGQELLREIAPILSTQSVFLYIDPFGLDCEFDVIQPFLERNPQFSTEILINLNISGLHRLAARNAWLSGEGDSEQIKSWHEKLTRTLGGDYWRDILLTENLETKRREQMLVHGYKKRLSSTGYLTYTGSCPIQKHDINATKYHMIFASPHPDAMVLFNDSMCKAFNEYMTEETNKDTLFANLNWEDWRDTRELVDIVVEYTIRHPGLTRKSLWPRILKDHFMRFMEKEYRTAVKEAVDDNRIVCSTPIGSKTRPTKRLNDDCVLMPISVG